MFYKYAKQRAKMHLPDSYTSKISYRHLSNAHKLQSYLDSQISVRLMTDEFLRPFLDDVGFDKWSNSHVCDLKKTMSLFHTFVNQTKKSAVSVTLSQLVSHSTHILYQTSRLQVQTQFNLTYEQPNRYERWRIWNQKFTWLFASMCVYVCACVYPCVNNLQ